MRTPSGKIAAAASVLVLVLGVASATSAALTTDKCLVKKRLAWSTLRKCQASADVKRLKGKVADFAKCQTKFGAQLAKIDAQAAKAGIACRFGANANQTVTDYDTGLMWEMKDGLVGGLCFLIPIGGVSHCVNFRFNWVDAQSYVAGTTTDETVVPPFLAGHSDWRLPTIVELSALIDRDVPGCEMGSTACIDPIFGPTARSSYWSSTTYPSADFAALLSFGSQTFVSGGHKINLTSHVRAVRNEL